MPDRLLAIPLTPRERDVLRLMALDMSIHDIAVRLVVSPQTVKWYVKEIYSKLGVHSRDEAVALAETLNASAEPVAHPALFHLPAPVTSLVGRTREIAAICAMLRDPAIRLVTLLGAPGIGKTRLSLEVAQRMAAGFPDGVVFVPLAPLTDPGLVGDALLSALGLDAEGSRSAAERLRLFLNAKHLLLVLDNFEHLLDAVPLAGDLLAEAPGLKVLATSREALRVYGEREYAVPPLDVTSDAVTLFAERTRAVRPDFDVDEHNAVTLTAICKRLDGLPLAIELAAARMKLYTPHALLGRLAGRLNVLTSGTRDQSLRQQTLRASIEWSHDLLTVDEQRMFARFAAFDGGASLEAFVEVCGGGLALDALEGLESLISKSLIQRSVGADGEPRFTMYEMLIEFAAERLAASGEAEAVTVAHARFYLMVAAAYGHSFRTAHEVWGMRGFEADYANIRAAWLFAAARPDDELIGIAAGKWWRLYTQVGSVRDGVFLYETALQPRVEDGTLVEARLMLGQYILDDLLGDIATSEPYLQQAYEIFERCGDAEGKVISLLYMGLTALGLGEQADGERHLHTALHIARSEENPFLIDLLVINLTVVEVNVGRFGTAIQMLEERLENVRQRGVRSMEAWICSILVAPYAAIGDYERAKSCASAGLVAAQTTFMRRAASGLNGDLALVAFLTGDLAEARERQLLALEYPRDTGMHWNVWTCYTMMAAIEARRGDVESARNYWERAAHTFTDVAKVSFAEGFLVGGHSASPYVALALGRPELAVEIAAAVHSNPLVAAFDQVLVEVALPELRAQFTPEAFQAAWARGAAYSVDELIAAVQRI